jgi:2-dehydro-3-deoxyphosphogalactonate aldolase
MITLANALPEVPIIAILRGIEPHACVPVAEVLYRAGIRIMEVPLNSPDPYASIRTLCDHFGADCLIGAGTVLRATEVRQTHQAGGRLVVAPNVEVQVIREALESGLDVVPGVATATEAFLAIHAGATTLKLFPAATYGPAHLKALKAVMPSNVAFIPVGGIGALDVEPWLKAGSAGFGFGSELFKPGFSLSEIHQRASEIVAAVSSLAGHPSAETHV